MKRKDFAILGTITLIITALFLYRYSSRNVTGEYVTVSQDGKRIGTYSLKNDDTVTIGSNTLSISGGHVCMLEADCPDNLCVKQGEISMIGESIVCLPNRITVEIIGSNNPISRDGFFFNTYVNITLYDSTASSILDGAMNLCSKYEKICSRTNSDSELYLLNHRLISDTKTIDEQTCYKISDELYDMIKIGLEFSKETNDVFDIAIAPVTDLWDFTSGNTVIPDEYDIKNALNYVSSSDITLYEDNYISFKHPENMIDLGGMAKGYIADRLKEYLLNNNVQSAIISLGGNILCVGSKNGTSFKVGIKEPFNEQNILSTVSVTDKSVVTSGIYERYFKKDGTIYHHILDSKTGYPINNDLYSVTIVSDSSVLGDCMSTYIYSLGTNDAQKYAASRNDIEVILVNNEKELIK